MAMGGCCLSIVDPSTGELIPTQLFVAVWGASNYTYAEATWTQSLPDWIGSHQRCFAFLGGVPEIEGFFLACGFSGHGFMHSPTVGKLMAEIIVGRKSSLDVSRLSANRLSETSFTGQEENVFI